MPETLDAHRKRIIYIDDDEIRYKCVCRYNWIRQEWIWRHFLYD